MIEYSDEIKKTLNELKITDDEMKILKRMGLGTLLRTNKTRSIKL